MASGPPQPTGRRVVRMGKYEVVAHIATGGMGAVYRARDTETGRDVALKVLNPEMAGKPAMLERFRREAKHAAKLKHENIVTLYEFDQIKETYYLALEFVNGIDLHEYVKRKELAPEEARVIILQGCRALRHAFEQGIIHRDVKPSNFLITRKKGRPLVKLTDLGLAREANNEDFRVTRAGTTVGTLDYMAPEQARDSGSADIRSDLYSLGGTWYHLLTGQAPFPKGGLAERLYKIMNEDPPDVRELCPRASEQTWNVLSRLLAKAPEDRYQTPAELLDDLLALEGQAAVSADEAGAPTAGSAGKKALTKKGPRPAPAPEDTDEDGPATVATRGPSRNLLYAGAGGALLFLLVLVVAFSGPSRSRKRSEQAGTNPPPVEQPPPSRGPGPTPKVVPKVELPKVEPPKPRWLPLYKGRDKIDAVALRKKVEAPWTERPPPASAEPVVLRVARAGLAPPFYLSLAEACAAAPASRPIVLELHDNGPFFDVGVAVEQRDLTVRAGAGYRPLLVWDVQRTLDDREHVRPRGKKGADKAEARTAEAPLVFLRVRKGNLTLEGLDVALRWPESAGKHATLLEVNGGDLTARHCTFSVAGTNRDGVTLAHFTGGRAGKGRCRLTRCHVRGTSLTALDLDAPGAQALLENCLLVGGPVPLLKVRADAETETGVRVVSSTLVSGGNLLELTPTVKGGKPRFSWLGWDALLSRAGTRAAGELLSVREGGGLDGISWQAHNCFYAGWGSLLAGAKVLGGDAVREWEAQWGQTEGDGATSLPWPQQDLNEPATLAAERFIPAGPVAYASSKSAERPLGCDLSSLAVRDGWLASAIEPLPPPVEALVDATAPDIPAPGDRLYHGERLEVADLDVGAYLWRKQSEFKFGPRVVLHLTGKGQQTTSPIRIKGSSLVLHFEPPAAGVAPLALKLANSIAGDALIDVQGGGLDIIGGELHVPDLQAGAIAGTRVPYLLKVRGGDLRLFRCRLEGPQRSLPTNYEALIHLEGSGTAALDKARSCAITESVLVSGRGGVVLHGIGARLLIRQGLLVAGTTALHTYPGPACRDRVNVSCVLENVTVAAGVAALHLGDAAEAGTPQGPVSVQARDCAFLNPFPGRQNKAGLLMYEGGALARGLLVWQSERDTFDRRLHFSPWQASHGPSAKVEKVADWARLWGSRGVREVRPDLPLLKTFALAPKRWDLWYLILPSGRGADLGQLGVRRPRSGL